MSNPSQIPGPEKKNKNALVPLLQGKAQNFLQTFVSPVIQKHDQKKLTGASIVYALASGVFFIIAISYLFMGPVLGGLLMFLPAAILAGFSLRSLQ